MEHVEKRQIPRQHFTCEIECIRQKRDAAEPSVPAVLYWRVIDISASGIGVVATEPVDLLAPVQVRFRFAHVAALISTLMQVRWIHAAAVPGGTHRVGLSYLV
jgi:hypothetical protein